METAQQHRPRWHFGILWHWIVPWLNAPGGAQPGEKQRIRVRDRGPGVLTGHAAAQRGTAGPRCAPSPFPFCSLGRFTCFLSFSAAKPKRIESSLTSPPFFFFFRALLLFTVSSPPKWNMHKVVWIWTSSFKSLIWQAALLFFPETGFCWTLF